MNPKYRLILMLGLILVVSFLSISFLNYNAARYTLRTEITEASLPLLRENIYSEIQRDFLPSLNIASAMANDSLLIDWINRGEQTVSTITQYLSRIRKQYGFVSTFFVSSETGNYYHNTGLLKTISPSDSHDIWFYDFVASGKEYELDVDSDEAKNGNLTIFINNRLEDTEGRFLGVTGVGIEVETFSRFLESQQERYNRRIYLVNRQGIIQAHSDTGMIEQADINNLPGVSDLAPEILQADILPFNGSYRDNKSRVLITSRLMPEIEWYVIVEQDESAALARVRLNLLRTIIIGLIASFLVLLLAILTINGYGKQLESIATTDSLTGTANRRALEAALPRMLYRGKRFERAVSLLVLDIDHFKEVNDTQGHEAGDDILRELTDTITSLLHPDDLLVRWGGDEFAVALESAAHDAESLAEEIRKTFKIRGRGATLSIGITEANDQDDLKSMMKRADNALYQAKDEGRDRIVVDSGIPGTIKDERL